MSNPHRVPLLHIDLVQLNRPGHILRRHLPFLRQRIDRGVGDVVPIHFEVTTQIRAGIRAAEAIGAQHGVAHRDEGADLVGEAADVVGGGDGGALSGFEEFGDVGFARGLGFGVEAVPAFGVEAVAA